MIILLTGDNYYEIDQELARIEAAFDGTPEHIDPDTLQSADLTDILSGMSLFSTKRLVVLRRASENTPLWEALGERASEESDTTLVLYEPKVDKRTKTYKSLAKHADVRAFTAWSERDAPRAEQWLLAEAKTRNMTLDKNAAHEIVRRRGVEQHQLINTLQQLAAMGNITLDVVQRHIEPTPTENVFALLGAALSDDVAKVHDMLQTLRLTNDPYMTIGLLSSQVFSLAGLVLSDKPQAEVAKEIGVSPYVLRGLAGTAKQISPAQLRRFVGYLAAADIGLKSSSIDPWVQIELALTKKI